MSKVIFYYDDEDGYATLLRCFNDYSKSRNVTRTGVQSITIYASHTRTAYFKRAKSGIITAKTWILNPNHKEPKES